MTRRAEEIVAHLREIEMQGAVGADVDAIRTLLGEAAVELEAMAGRIAQAEAVKPKPPPKDEPPPRPPRHHLPNDRDGLDHHVQIFSQKERAPGRFERVVTDIYIRTGCYPNGSLGEIFASLDQAGSRVGSLVDAWCIAVSIGLQHGIPLETFTSKARYAQYEPSGPTSNPTMPRCSSPLDYIARWLESKYVKEE